MVKQIIALTAEQRWLKYRKVRNRMQIVIDIPKTVYNYIMQTGSMNMLDTQQVTNAIFDGITLPKGHGKIIDVQDAVDNLMEYKEIGIFGNYDKRTILGCIDRIENHVEPIIEADTESEVQG